MRKVISGFTIVELLIVIVVIAILATISVVAYSGIQDRATASAAKSDIANFAKRIELAKIETADGGYPTTLTAGMGIKASKTMYMEGRWNWYYCLTPDHSSYSLLVVTKHNKGFYQSSVGGLEEATGNIAGTGSTQNCAKVGTTPASSAASGSSSGGYQWNSGTSTGTWQTWTN